MRVLAGNTLGGRQEHTLAGEKVDGVLGALAEG